MTKRLLTLIAAATLAACATPQRDGPPAPVVSASRPAPAPVVAPPPVEAPKKPAPRPVQVYAYKPPSEAARIPDETQLDPYVAGAARGAGPVAPEAPGAAAPTAAGVPVGAAAAAAPPKAPAAKPSAPAPGPEAAAAAAPQTAAAVAPASPADALRGKAERQRQAGDFAGAAATLENALGHQPRDALLWNRLARVRLEQGQQTQAANLAAKSNSLAGDQASLRQDNWSIIATARRQAGDAAGAAEAERKARGV